MADNDSARKTRKRRCKNVSTYSERNASKVEAFKSNNDDNEGNGREKSIEELFEKQTEELEEKDRQIQSLKVENEKIKKKLEDFEKKQEVSTVNSIISPAEKSFVMKHVFKNISILTDGKTYFSKLEDHFGVPWRICIFPNEDDFGAYLYCEKPLDTGKWSIGTEFQMKLSLNNGRSVANFNGKKYEFGNANGNLKKRGRGFTKMIQMEKLKQILGTDDKLHVEIHVGISKMTGIYKDNLRCFDETMEEISDVILVVKDQKFYVSKLSLAAHSDYFKTLFLGQFQESKKSKINLTGIDADDFQNYLEVLYGEPAIDDTTIEGILLIADMYNTPTVIKKCEEFLIEKSKKEMRKKLEMSMRFNLEKLKTKCLSDIKSTSDIRALLPGNLQDMDPSLMSLLLEKSISLC